jgi:uncharacterized protein (TIGR02246 family)
MTQKKIILLFFAIVLATGRCATAQSSSCAPADEAAVRQLVKDFAATWATHSTSTYAAAFAEDADWENAFGDHIRGRKNIEQGMTPAVQTLATAEETVTDVRVLCLRPDLALVDIYETISGQKTPKGIAIPTRHVRLSQIHEKRDGKWLIRVHRVADLRGFDKQPKPDQDKQKSATPGAPS